MTSLPDGAGLDALAGDIADLFDERFLLDVTADDIRPHLTGFITAVLDSAETTPTKAVRDLLTDPTTYFEHQRALQRREASEHVAAELAEIRKHKTPILHRLRRWFPWTR